MTPLEQIQEIHDRLEALYSSLPVDIPCMKSKCHDIQEGVRGLEKALKCIESEYGGE